MLIKERGFLPSPRLAAGQPGRQRGDDKER